MRPPMNGFRHPTAIATTAAFVVLISCATLAGNASSPTIVVFGQNGSSSPRYSIWSGSSWSSDAAMPSVGGEPHWAVLRNCPTRNETACATFDSNNEINILFFDGVGWTGATELTSDAGANTHRRMDLCYESSSGDLLIAYWDYDGGSTKEIGYRTYAGSGVSGESHLTVPSSADVVFLTLVASPNSDEVLMLAMNWNRDLYAAIWNGTGWGTISTLETDLQSNTTECIAAAYESQSGDALVVYHQSDENKTRYRIWNGSSWTSELQMPEVGDNLRWLRLVADPASDEIIFGATDDGNDLDVCVWNGSSWGSVLTVEPETQTVDQRQFDIAYEAGGGEALLVYNQREKSEARYRTWDGANWSSEQQCPDTDQVQTFIQLQSGSATGEVFVAFSDTSRDLELLRWDGASMSPRQKLETDLGGTNDTEAFMVAAPVASSVIPANIPYFTDFQSGVGPEWSNPTTDTSGALTTFLGRFNKAPVELSLNTTVGETYTLRFDLYAIDSWDPSGNTSEDALAISIDGTVAFDEAFSQRPTTYPPTFLNPAKSQGHFGYDGSYEEGVYEVTVSFVATGDVTTISFQDNLNEDVGNESTGLDNVSVALSRFRDVSTARGFDVQTSTDAAYAAGLHWADLDADGDLDAIVGGDSSSRRMINNSEGASFTASTFGSGNEYGQAALFDAENDGDVDLWSGNHASLLAETCFLNDGGAGFTDAGSLSFSSPAQNEGVAAADINRDGWCDILHFSQNGNWIGEHQGEPGSSAIRLTGTINTAFGLNDPGDSGNGDYCSAGDVNNDGYLDFFYHYNGGKLFLSNGDGTYYENALGISVVTGANDKLGSAWGDYDNDGDLDLFAARYDAGSTGYLWRNDVVWGSTPTGTFTDRGADAYVLDASGQRSGAWGDYDNDGDLDLYVATRNAPNRLYRNEGDGTFRLVDEGAGIGGDGHDAVFVDYDNDGDLDIAYTREDTTNVLIENRTDNSNYLKVRLVGSGGGATNAAAIGVRVELWDETGATRIGRRDVGVARGFGGTEPLWAHFGGIDPATTYLLKVFWHSLKNDAPLEITVVPGSVSTTIGAVTIPQMITVTEGAARKRIIQWREVPNRA